MRLGGSVWQSNTRISTWECGIAASTYREYVTMLDASMNYLLPVEHTEYVYCKARVLRHGRKITVVRVELLNDEQTLLIDGSFTFYSIRKRDE